jgi:putative drug exporter of the RND superfamily
VTRGTSDAPGTSTGGSLPEGWWPRVGRFVTTRPGFASGLALLILLPLILAATSMQLVNDVLADLPDDSEAVEGFEALARHFAPGDLSPVVLVIDDDEPLTRQAAFRALGDLSRNLKRLESVASVRSAAMPTDGVAPDLRDSDEVADVLDEVAGFEEQLGLAADGAGQLADGLAQVEAGLAEIDARLPELSAGLDEAADGGRQLAEGAAALRAGLAELDAGLAQLGGGIGELRAGLGEAEAGAVQLRDEVAAPAEASVREAWRVLAEDFSVGRADPAYRRALESVGETYGRLTGEDPRTGQQVEAGYDGLTAALDELAGGLGEARAGTNELADGVAQLQAGVGELDAGLAQLQAGAGELAGGLDEAQPGIAELATGIGELRAGAGELEAGAGELEQGLREGVVQLRDTGFEDLLPGGDDEGPFVLTPAMLELPDVRDRLGFFLAEEDTRTRVLVSLNASPFSPEGLAAVREVEEVANFSLQGSPLSDATLLATGTSAFLGELDEAAAADLPLIVAAVLIGVFLVLVLLLRALVAPVYMVLTTLLSYGAALGLTTVVFQWTFGDAGLAWWIPPFLFVILVGAGADYTIYLVSRIREEATHRSTREAVRHATTATGGVISSAGFILAGTFLALVFADLRPLAQMGFAVAAGIVIDTMVVRTLLVPAIATALGRSNWWPSRRGRQGATVDADRPHERVTVDA